MSAKKIIIPIVVAAIVACGVGYCSYNITKASTVSENTTNSSNDSSSLQSSNTNTVGIANTNSNSQQTNVTSTNTGNLNKDITSNNVASSNSNNSTTSATKNVTNSTSKSIQKTTSNTNNSSNNTTSSTNSNTNSAVLSYMGVWNPSIEALWNQDYTKNILPTKEQLSENTLILTNSEYSFKNITIKNPSYEIVKVTSANIFANMRMGGYGSVNNIRSEAAGANENSDLDFIVAVPQGASSNYINEVASGFNIFNYPYIVDGKLYAMLNSSENPIYQFSKQ